MESFFPYHCHQPKMFQPWFPHVPLVVNFHSKFPCSLWCFSLDFPLLRWWWIFIARFPVSWLSAYNVSALTSHCPFHREFPCLSSKQAFEPGLHTLEMGNEHSDIGVSCHSLQLHKVAGHCIQTHHAEPPPETSTIGYMMLKCCLKHQSQDIWCCELPPETSTQKTWCWTAAWNINQRTHGAEMLPETSTVGQIMLNCCLKHQS